MSHRNDPQPESLHNYYLSNKSFYRLQSQKPIATPTSSDPSITQKFRLKQVLERNALKQDSEIISEVSFDQKSSAMPTVAHKTNFVKVGAKFCKLKTKAAVP